MKRFRIPILLLIFLLNAEVLQADSRWNDYLRNDVTNLRKNMGLKTLLYSSGWVTSMYFLSACDEDLRIATKELYYGPLKQYFDAINYVGEAPYSVPVMLGFAGLTLLGNNKKFQDAAWTSVEAAGVNVIITATAKVLFGRSRPDENLGPRHFEPFTGLDDSFPSGHASTAFALVTPWVVYYPKPYMYLLYVIPAGTALARVIFDRHWTTDVLTGSLLGFLIGYNLARWHKDRVKEKNFYNGTTDQPMTISFSIPL